MTLLIVIGIVAVLFALGSSQESAGCSFTSNNYSLDAERVERDEAFLRHVVQERMDREHEERYAHDEHYGNSSWD